MNNSGQKLWGLLLVVDSFFVVIFGGALAAKVYEHWQPATPFTYSPNPSTAPLKKVQTPAPKPTTPLTPSPAIVSSMPSHPLPLKEKKSPKTKRDDEPKILPSRGKGKAQGVIFTYKNKKARKVFLTGAFLRHPGKKPFAKIKRGVWKLTVYLTPGNYHYSFLVDGEKILDPQNPKHERHASLFSIAKPRH